MCQEGTQDKGHSGFQVTGKYEGFLGVEMHNEHEHSICMFVFSYYHVIPSGYFLFQHRIFVGLASIPKGFIHFPRNISFQ